MSTKAKKSVKSRKGNEEKIRKLESRLKNAQADKRLLKKEINFLERKLGS